MFWAIYALGSLLLIMFWKSRLICILLWVRVTAPGLIKKLFLVLGFSTVLVVMIFNLVKMGSSRFDLGYSLMGGNYVSMFVLFYYKINQMWFIELMSSTLFLK